MAKEIRREELGKYFLDISKYVLTVVVVGAIAAARIDARIVLVGLGIGIAVGVVGFWTLPPDGETKERNQ